MVRSKSKVSEQSGRIAIDGITPEQFDQLVNLLVGWIAQGEVVVQFVMPLGVQLYFDEDNISKNLKEKQLPSNCISQLRNDIPFMLQAILGGHRKAVASFITDNSTASKVEGKPKPTKEQIRKEVDIRIYHVEKEVVTSDLRRQFAIKSSAKTNTYLSASWDIVQKRSDSTISIAPDIVHATVRLNAQKPPAIVVGREIFMPFPIAGYGVEFENYVLTMTLQDLQDLIKELMNAVKALKQAIEAEQRT